MKTLAGIGITALLAVQTVAMAEPPTLDVGTPFPNITLPAMDDGRPLSIRDFRGRKVVLHVFASW